MSNLFKNLKVYEESWKVKSIDALDSEDLSLFDSGEIVKSTWGLSLKFNLKSGGSVFIPVDSRDETYKLGEFVDLNRVLVKTLSKSGEDDIQRIAFKPKQLLPNI